MLFKILKQLDGPSVDTSAASLSISVFEAAGATHSHPHRRSRSGLWTTSMRMMGSYAAGAGTTMRRMCRSVALCSCARFDGETLLTEYVGNRCGTDAVLDGASWMRPRTRIRGGSRVMLISWVYCTNR